MPRCVQSEAHLRESQQMLHLVLETMPVRVFWKDRNLTYLGCNHLFALDAGFTDSEQLIGKSDFDLSWHSQAPAFRADDQVVIESGLPKLQIEELLIRADGTQIWMQTNKIPCETAAARSSG